MSTSRKPASPRPPSPRAGRAGPPSNRNQVVLVAVSILVICGLVGGVFVGLGATDIFGDLFVSDTDRDNYNNPNEDVIAVQQTVVAESPDHLESVLLLASLLANSGRLGDAIPHYEHAMNLAPDDVDARLSFARSLADGGMHADAELQFHRVLDLDPESQVAHYYLAELYMAWNPPRQDEAIEHYRRAAAIDATTLIGERSQTQVNILAPGSSAATPMASPAIDATPHG